MHLTSILKILCQYSVVKNKFHSHQSHYSSYDALNSISRRLRERGRRKSNPLVSRVEHGVKPLEEGKAVYLFDPGIG